jgi:hypothetical protein
LGKEEVIKRRMKEARCWRLIPLILATWEAEIGRPAWAKEFGRPSSQAMSDCSGTSLSPPVTWGSTNKRITVQADQGIKQDLISKITNGKRGEVVEHLPGEHEALSSHHSISHTQA